MSAPAGHPSRWTPAVLDAIAPVISGWELPVHDPFAATGERVGALCDRLGLGFTGTEIEPDFIGDGQVNPGDSTSPDTYPPLPPAAWCVVTSPVYPNGMTDHFRARDGSVWHTYRQALATITGRDRPLHPNNIGAYGPRRGRTAEATHWRLVVEAVVARSGGRQREGLHRSRSGVPGCRQMMRPARHRRVADVVTVTAPGQDV